MTPADLERATILPALLAAHGSRPAAALALGWPLRTLQRRVAALWTPGELAAHAPAHGWPLRGSAARAARSARALERRIEAAQPCACGPVRHMLGRGAHDARCPRSGP